MPNTAFNTNDTCIWMPAFLLLKSLNDQIFIVTLTDSNSNLQLHITYETKVMTLCLIYRKVCDCRFSEFCNGKIGHGIWGIILILKML